MDVEDLVNETFFRALERLHQVHDASGFKSWLTSIAVFVAREHLRQRRRRRWLQLWDTDKLPEPPAPAGTPEAVDAAIAVRHLYRVLEGMPEDERIAFAFRFVDEMELTEVASACSVSLATIKRTLARAEARFAARARRAPRRSEPRAFPRRPSPSPADERPPSANRCSTGRWSSRRCGDRRRKNVSRTTVRWPSIGHP